MSSRNTNHLSSKYCHRQMNEPDELARFPHENQIPVLAELRFAIPIHRLIEKGFAIHPLADSLGNLVLTGTC